jgi:hypothetical protein
VNPEDRMRIGEATGLERVVVAIRRR